MTDPDLVRVLGRQTPAPVRWADRVTADLSGHVLLDAVTDADLDRHAAALLDRAEAGTVDLWGGASGLAAALARALAGRTTTASPAPAPVPDGPRLVVSGSCSEQTRAQVAAFRGPTVALTPDRLDPEAALAAIARAYAERPDGPVLVSTTAAPDDVRAAQLAGGSAAEVGSAVETALAEVTARAVERYGVGQLLVAGGETSGAVCRRLGLRALEVREHVAPGLAWCSPRPDPGLRVLLKSGNFGADDLFTGAWL